MHKRRLLRSACAWPPRFRRCLARDGAVNEHAREEAIVAVDKFRTDNGLAYQGNAAGLVDVRFIDALRAAYLKKKKG